MNVRSPESTATWQDGYTQRMLIAYIPAAFAVLGAIGFGYFKSHAEAKEISRLIFWCGFLVTMFTLAARTVHLG